MQGTLIDGGGRHAAAVLAVATALLLGATAPASAAAPPDDAVVSPDGKRVAWVSDDGKSIWSAKRRSRPGHPPTWGEPDRLLTTRGTVGELVFAPDSRRIAFENPRGDHGFIGVFGLRDDRIRFVDPSFGTDSDPRWSRNGRRISFVRHVEGVPDERRTEPVPSGSKDQRRAPFSLESILAAPFVSELTASGDGRTVAYAARAAAARAIYVMRVGDRARRVVNYPRDDGQELLELTVSEHGGALAYARGGEPNDEGDIANPNSLADPPTRELWVVGATGGASRQLGGGHEPRFSPDERRVVWLDGQSLMSASLSWRNGRLAGVGSPTRLLTFTGSIGMLRFSPDGTRLAYEHEDGIEVYDFAADTTTTVTHDGSWPAWSPDGTRIAFIRTGDAPFSIHVADLAAGTESRAWQAQAGVGEDFYRLDQDDQLLWSADDRIAFTWEGDGWRHLYAVPAAGGEATLLTPGEGEVESAALTLDRTRIQYVTNIGDIGRRHLARTDFTGAAPEPITRGRHSQWAATPVAGGLAYIDAGWADPPTVTLREASGDTRRVDRPRPRADFPADQLVEPQLVEFPGSDGQTAYGQLFVPAGGTGRRCAVVFPHGGPRRSMLPGFHYMEIYTNLYELNQYLTSRGCAVLSVDYRSGIMHGHAFRTAPGVGRSGAAEYRDILGAAAYLKARPDVDPERIGIYGLSWGGYLTALGLARDSATFKAGFDMAGVHEFFGDAFPYSPAADIDRWTSPVYLAQGDDDRNVDFSQGVILAQLLQSRRPDVEFEQHVFPDETHDLNLTFDDLVEAYEGGSEFLLDHLSP